jgi:hypothetical protein
MKTKIFLSFSMKNLDTKKQQQKKNHKIKKQQNKKIHKLKNKALASNH